MFSRFFIDRPIFAAVLSIVITLAGGIALFTLPLAQFPLISPPTVRVTCNYPGASAVDVAKSVAAPIEQQVNGVEGIMYMSSQCTNDGTYNLTVTFKPGVNLNMAQVLVQNRVSLAIPALPTVIKQTGVTTKKQPPDPLMGMAITSPDRTYDQLYISNFAVLQVKDELSRMSGVADVLLLGQRDYSMRIWVDPDKLAARNMSAADVAQAVREQNAQVATGVIGRPPVAERAAFEMTMSTLGRLSDTEQFENIILKTSHDGRVLRLKDVARVELGAKNQDTSVRFAGGDTVFVVVFQLPDANALDVHDAVLAKMEELKRNFPKGIDYTVAFDTTPYTRESIREVFKTLVDAIVLVAIVVLVFLQNWRSSLIPLVAVPVAIIGTFSVMAVMGFSLNNLTLFGLVLAIGIVVDDAIVVVEAVEHHIENGLPPREATILAMEQVSGPVIAVGLVLSAVFVPCAFISGITGVFFRQFALTIAVSTIISCFNSLTLSPALTVVLMRAHDKGAAPPLPRLGYALAGVLAAWQFGLPHLHEVLASERLTAAMPGILLGPWMQATWATAPWTWGAMVGGLLLAVAVASWLAGCAVNWMLRQFFKVFNAVFRLFTWIYTQFVGLLLFGSVLVLVAYVGLVGLTYQRFVDTPKGFIPSQDMGYLLVDVQLPDSYSAEMTDEVLKQIEAITAREPGIRFTTAIGGQSFVLSAIGSNFATMFLGLKDYADRRSPELVSEAIAKRMREQFEKVVGAQIRVFGPPPVRGVGRAGGWALMIEDRGDDGLALLQEQTENLVAKARQTPGLANVFSAFRANVPQLHIAPNNRECMTKGVNLKDFADTLQVYEGSLYVNDFNLFGRTWQVNIQADHKFRDQVEDLPKLKVRNQAGQMVPLGSLCDVEDVNGPLVLNRYNMYAAASINGAAAPGTSSGDAIKKMVELARDELPGSMAFEWTEMSYLELMAANTAMIIFAFAVIMVFLVLAAQYESWSLPLAIILVVPMCLLSAIIGVNYFRMDINIFTQIGFVVLVGLASKNAILIVEFAKQQRLAGRTARQATLDACRLRLRPIVMTSLAFILGVWPLIVARGAGAEMRRTLGVAVFSGMLGVTLFGLVLTPVFFYAIDWVTHTRLFSTRWVRRLNEWSLGWTLGPLRRGVSRMVERAGRRKVLLPPRAEIGADVADSADERADVEPVELS